MPDVDASSFLTFVNVNIDGMAHVFNNSACIKDNARINSKLLDSNKILMRPGDIRAN